MLKTARFWNGPKVQTSQGGAKFPTGGKWSNPSARERLLVYAERVKQIRCKPEADGHSPDGREEVEQKECYAHLACIHDFSVRFSLITP